MTFIVLESTKTLTKNTIHNGLGATLCVHDDKFHLNYAHNKSKLPNLIFCLRKISCFHCLSLLVNRELYALSPALKITTSAAVE